MSQLLYKLKISFRLLFAKRFVIFIFESKEEGINWKSDISCNTMMADIIVKDLKDMVDTATLEDVNLNEVNKIINNKK